MKTITRLFLCMLLLTPLLVKAQEPLLLSSVRVNAGLKLGANLAKLDGENWDGGYKTNLLGGIYVRIHNGRWGVQGEGFFTQSDYTTGKDFNSIYKQYLQAGKDSLSKGTFRVSYFNIPLMAQVKLLSRVWLQVGAQYSGIVSVKDKDQFVKDAEGLFDNGSFAAIGGLWLDLPLHFNVGARYILGFSNLNNVNETTAQESWKQRNVQIHVGYNIF